VLIFRREKTASHTNMLAWRTPAWFVVIVGAAGGIALAALAG
jgi:hypothetical protein